jgi:hypothetical protein
VKMMKSREEKEKKIEREKGGKTEDSLTVN